MRSFFFYNIIHFWNLIMKMGATAELSQVVGREQSKNKMDLLQSGKSFKRWKML